MRRTLLAILLTAALLLAPLAMAAGGEAGRAKAEAAKARAADAQDVRADDDRSAPMQRFVERLHAMRASWLENATAVREGCRAQALDDNASKDDRTAWAHCIRDGYAEWRAQKRVEMKELRLELRALFENSR